MNAREVVVTVLLALLVAEVVWAALEIAKNGGLW